MELTHSKPQILVPIARIASVVRRGKATAALAQNMMMIMNDNRISVSLYGVVQLGLGGMGRFSGS